MARSRELRVVISGDTSSLNRAFARAGAGAQSLEGRVGRASTGIGRHLGTMAKVGAAAVGVGLVGALKGSIDAFAEAQKIATQTNTVLKSTGGAANLTAKQISDLATAISRKSGMDDEAIQSGENLLLTFTKLRNEQGKGNDIFTQATQIMADMSTALGQDTKSSAIQLGKALNDPIKGVTALQRVGVSFTASQKEQIKTLVDSGKTMDAQKLILKELQTEFGGSAEAAGTTFAGKINKAKVAVGNLGEAIGGALAPAIGTAAEKLAGFVDKLATSDRPAKFFDGLKDRVGDAKDLFSNLFDDIGQRRGQGASLGGAIGGAFSQAVSDINWGEIGDKISAGLSGALKVSDNVSKNVEDGIRAAFSNVDGAAVLGGLVDAIGEAIDALFSPKFWRDHFAGIFAAVTLVIPVAKILKIPGAGALYNFISRPFFSAVARVGSVLTTLFSRVASRAFTAFLAGVERFAPRVADAMLKVATGGVGAFRRFPGQVATIASRAVNGIADRIGDRIGNVAAEMLRLGIQLGKSLASGIARGVRSTIGRVTGAITGGIGSIASKLNPFGEGIGKKAVGGLPKIKGVGGLDGANPIMGVFASEGSRFGLHVSSGRSSHSTLTSTGNVSYHSTGEAIDLANGRGPDPSKLRAARYLAGKYGSRLAELIYSPLGFSIKNGQRVAPYAVKDHYDHVHVALDTGKPGPGDGWGKRLRGAFTGDGSGRKYNGPELARLWMRAGGSGNVAGLMARVALAESGGDPRAHNPSGATGLWQILGAVRPGNLYDPLVNARNAVAKYKAGGLHPWDASRSVWGKYIGHSGITAGSERKSAAGSTHHGGGGGQSISEMVAGEEERSRKTIARQGGTSIAPPTWSQRFAESDLAITISQGGSVQDQIGALTKQRLLIGQRISRVRGLLARKGDRALTRANRLKYTQELGTLIGNDRSAAESLFGLAAGTGVETPEPPSELDWLQAAAAEAGLTPDKADDIGAATGIRDLRARQLQFARAAGDPRGVAEFASALKDAQDALDGLTGSAQDAENAMKEHTDALNAVASELKRQTDFAQSVQSTESFQLKRALADVLSGAIAGRGIARSYAPGFGVEARY